ncbi:MAG: NAD(P)-dependent oxidoreductase [Planctomycetia bacterium]|jgi:3-hydroxyisobutyrate dehydrogenase|nr:NAD(P)-dependent oxidoreductase [Planctomycetia bacterium]
MAAPVTFIGTGIMGGSMAGHLLAAGHPLHVHSRTRAKAEPLLARGATWHDTPASAAADGQVVITMLGLPSDVEQVYFGTDGSSGIIATAAPGSLLIDMTTSSPRLAERIAAAAAARGLAAVDAPVSGGDVGARNAQLVIMAGGDQPAFERARPLLELLGKSVTRLGAAGSGQRCKLANQVAVAVGMVAWCEALAVARAGGLDAAAVQQVISGGAAGSWGLTNLAPRALAGDFAPGFLVRHLVKDIHLARQEAEVTGLELPGLAVAERLYGVLEATGNGDEGTQALLRQYGW